MSRKLTREEMKFELVEAFVFRLERLGLSDSCLSVGFSDDGCFSVGLEEGVDSSNFPKEHDGILVQYKTGSKFEPAGK